MSHINHRESVGKSQGTRPPQTVARISIRRSIRRNVGELDATSLLHDDFDLFTI